MGRIKKSPTLLGMKDFFGNCRKFLLYIFLKSAHHIDCHYDGRKKVCGGEYFLEVSWFAPHRAFASYYSSNYSSYDKRKGECRVETSLYHVACKAHHCGGCNHCGGCSYGNLHWNSAKEDHEGHLEGSSGYAYCSCEKSHSGGYGQYQPKVDRVLVATVCSVPIPRLILLLYGLVLYGQEHEKGNKGKQDREHELESKGICISGIITSYEGHDCRRHFYQDGKLPVDLLVLVEDYHGCGGCRHHYQLGSCCRLVH